MSKKVIIIGAAGRMGKALIRCLIAKSVPGLELAGAVDLATVPEQGQDLGSIAGAQPAGINLTSDLPSIVNGGDLFIDFSFHTGIKERGELLAAAGKSWIIGTTGMTEAELASVHDMATRIPVVLAPNMSLGVNLLSALVEEAAARLKGRGYDIEVIEAHHRKKLDAPSGTALFLGEAAARGSGWSLKDVAVDGRTGIASGERPEEQIGFHALRGGDIVGDHDVIFAAEGELLELSHRATSRDTFALGALRATDWLAGQPAGLYSMKDVLGLNG